MKNNMKVKAEMLKIASDTVDSMIQSIDYYKKEIVEFEETPEDERNSWAVERCKGYAVTIEAYEKLIQYLEKLA